MKVLNVAITRPRPRARPISKIDVFICQYWFSWDIGTDTGGRRIENRLQQGDQIPEPHLRAWRLAREELLGNVLTWVRLVIDNISRGLAKSWIEIESCIRDSATHFGDVSRYSCKTLLTFLLD